MKRIAVLGSTGSIGTQTLDVVRKNDDMQIVGLSACRSVELLEKQVREFHPQIVAVYDEAAAADLKVRLADLPVKVVSGMNGLLTMASMQDADVLVTAISGMIGIRPTLAAIEAGKDIALANKETLVTAGHLVMPLAKEKGVRILPVDSEHSAIFQCLEGERRDSVRKLLITASGGPFRGKKADELVDITVEQALSHPTWNMGAKITIDSATLVNKGLEVMEAQWLFGIPVDQIQVLVQPQSVVHSMVEFKDGTIAASLGPKDMRLDIQYALTYPERRNVDYSPSLNFSELAKIIFEDPDTETFRGIPLAIRAAKTGGSMPVVFNASNEWAVAQFLNRKIGFTDIYRAIECCMDRHTSSVVPNPDVNEILAAEADARAYLKSGYHKMWRRE